MKLQRDVEYGLMSLIDLNRENGQEHAASARTLAGRLGVPRELLRKVLQRLQRAGMLAAARGATGGYRLARPLGDISLREVIEASRGPLRVADCLGPRRCSQEASCTIRSQVHALQGLLQGFLGSLSVQAFAETKK